MSWEVVSWRVESKGLAEENGGLIAMQGEKNLRPGRKSQIAKNY
jgi:hypothetical protein